MREDIISKLTIFLHEHNPLTEECHVVYLLVQIRKLLELDIEARKRYSILKFYSNWAIHTRKDRDNKAIHEIAMKIEISIEKAHRFENTKNFIPAGTGILEFINFVEFKKEISDFFKKHLLPNELFVKEPWNEFIYLLNRVLSDQPILNPTQNIRKIYLQECIRGAGCVCVELTNGENYQILSYESGDIGTRNTKG